MAVSIGFSNQIDMKYDVFICYNSKDKSVVDELVKGNRNPFVDKPEFADIPWYPVYGR